MSCRVYNDTQDDDTLLLRQVWETRKPMQRYVASEAFRAILAAIDLGLRPPEVRFDTIAESAGFEFIEQVRNHTLQLSGNKEIGR